MKPTTPAYDLLHLEHLEIEESVASLLTASRRLHDNRIAALAPEVDRLRRLLAVHFQREEVALYPALRGRYPALLARMQDQHDYIRAVEQELTERLAHIPAEPRRAWISALRSWVCEYSKRIRSHASDEEEQLFPVTAACLRGPAQSRIARRMLALRFD